MPHKDLVARIVYEKDVIILDGALATELETRGFDLNHPLWSAKVLKEQPEEIYQVHLDYFRAGADIAITASYQASTLGLKQHFGLSEDESRHLIRTSVSLAQNARTDARREKIYGDKKLSNLLIAGSVGPYGAYLADGSEYKGDYTLPKDEMKAFHRPRIQALVDAGADILACETMPSFPEIQALASLLQEEFPNVAAWVSCTVRDPQHLSDGTLISDVVHFLDSAPNIVALGVNCIPMQTVSEVLEKMSRYTSKPLVAYPNSGETWDGNRKIWVGESGIDASVRVKQWSSQGARLIGGCCRTGPGDIKRIQEALDRSGQREEPGTGSKEALGDRML